MTYPWSHLIDAAWPRFIQYLDARDPCGCWPWMGGTSRGKSGRDRDVYGTFYVGTLDGRPIIVRAHIFAAAAAGEGFPGRSRDHYVCQATLCCNPAHMEDVTGAENSRRSWISTPASKRRKAA